MRKLTRRERMYMEFTDAGFTEQGLLQFREKQSTGRLPDVPDSFFLGLEQGKHQFDYLQSEYQKMFFAREWWGLLTFWKDWEGKRWLLPYLLGWHNDLPEWLTLEISLEELERSWL